MQSLHVAEMESPVGSLVVGARDDRTCLVAFAADGPAVTARLERHLGPLEQVPAVDPGGAVTALNRYFEGDVSAIDGLAVDYVGTTFQQSVWEALRSVPVGQTTSYQAIATAVGSPGAVRAVGSANGANPIVVIVPCHRVVRSDGGLGGYGGGLGRKRWLLDHESSGPAMLWSEPAVTRAEGIAG